MLKSYQLSAICELYQHQIFREVALHASLKHENVVQLSGAFQVGLRQLVCLRCAGLDVWHGGCRPSGRHKSSLGISSLVLQQVQSRLSQQSSITECCPFLCTHPAIFLPICLSTCLPVLAFPNPKEGDFVVLVQEYAAGGNLFDLLQRYGGRLNEHVTVQMVLEPFLRVLQVHTQQRRDNMLLLNNEGFCT